MDNKSISHTRWNCTYHIVFIPKYRRKIMYGETKADLVEIIKKLCEMKEVELIDGRVCKDHVHMYGAIPPKPPKMSVLDSDREGTVTWQSGRSSRWCNTARPTTWWKRIYDPISTQSRMTG